MAEKKAILQVFLEDGMSAGLNQLEQNVQAFKASCIAAAAAVAAIAAEAYKAISIFAEHETATNRLALALKNTGSNAELATKRLGELADTLSKTTGTSSIAITSFQALLATMGFNEKAIEEMTPRVLNLAKAMNIDAATAAMLLGKSIEIGSNASLRRMGIILGDTAFRMHDFSGVMQEIDQKTGKDFAEQMGNTTAGGVAKLRTAITELQKQIGELLSVAFNPFVNAVTSLIGYVSRLSNVLGMIGGVFDGLLLIFAANIQALMHFVDVLGFVTKGDWKGAYEAGKAGMNEWIGGIKAGIDAGRTQIADSWAKMTASMSSPSGGRGGGAPGKPGQQVSPEDAENQAWTKGAVDRKILTIKGYHKQVEILTQQHEARLAGIAQGAGKQQEVMSASTNKAILDGTSQFFNNLANLKDSKNKEMAAVGKAAAVANATVNTYLSATEAYAAMASIPWVGPALGYAAAAAAVVAGMANVAKIEGINFAEGGMVLPTSGGTMARIGEAGKKEAVIPLDDPRTKKKLADTLGGGGTHVHFHGTVVANQMGIEALASEIDKALFRLKRNRQTVSI